MNDFGLYVIITDPTLPYRTIAEICVARGVRMLQLRQKQLNDRETLAAAAQITAVTKGTDTLFVMNDRPDLAILSDADVLHLGQGDISIVDARRLTQGHNIRIGLSTHNIRQAREAMTHTPDYIGFGPVFPTPTKAIADPAVGTGLLSEVQQMATVPVVAIGGIDDQNLAAVLQTGARNVCLVRHLMQTDDLDQRIQNVQQRIAAANAQ